MEGTSQDVFAKFSPKGYPSEEQPQMESNEVPPQYEENFHQEQTTHNNTTSHGGGVRRVIKEIFGQFFTVDFWKEAARIVVQELFSTFLISFGNSVAYIGRQKRNDKVVNSSVSVPGVSDKAFGNRSISSVSSAPKADVMGRFGFN